MALTTAALVGVTLATAAVGTAVSYKGQQRVAQASMAAEEARKRQMDLETQRQKRQAIREGTIARGLALSNATTQGAQESSGVQGGIAQITGQQNQNLVTANQGQEIGNQIFNANEQIAQGQQTTALGNAITGFGQQVAQAAPTITRVGNYYGGFGV